MILARLEYGVDRLWIWNRVLRKIVNCKTLDALGEKHLPHEFDEVAHRELIDHVGRYNCACDTRQVAVAGSQIIARDQQRRREAGCWSWAVWLLRSQRCWRRHKDRWSCVVVGKKRKAPDSWSGLWAQFNATISPVRDQTGSVKPTVCAILCDSVDASLQEFGQGPSARYICINGWAISDDRACPPPAAARS